MRTAAFVFAAFFQHAAVATAPVCTVGVTTTLAAGSASFCATPPSPAPAPTPCLGGCITSTFQTSIKTPEGTCNYHEVVGKCGVGQSTEACATLSTGSACSLAEAGAQKASKGEVTYTSCSIKCTGGIAPLCTQGQSGCYFGSFYSTPTCSGAPLLTEAVPLDGTCRWIQQGSGSTSANSFQGTVSSSGVITATPCASCSPTGACIPPPATAGAPAAKPVTGKVNSCFAFPADASVDPAGAALIPQIYQKFETTNPAAAPQPGGPSQRPTPLPPPSKVSSGGSGHLSGGDIAGIVIACLAVVAVTAALIVYTMNKHKESESRRQSDSNAYAMMNDNGNNALRQSL